MPDDQPLDQPIEGEGAGDETGKPDTPEGKPDGKAGATDAGDEDAGADDGEDGGGEKDPKDQKNAKAPQKDTSKEGEDDEDKDDGKDPEVRKRLSKKDYIIQRQQNKLSKHKAEADDGGEGDEGEDDDVTPEDEALINRVVAKNFAPVIEKSLADDDNREISTFLTENPDFKPFEAKVRRYMQHESRRQLPVKSIFYEVAGDKLIKIGAERQKTADVEAKNSQTGGGSNRAGEGAKNDWDLSQDEFKAKQERIRQGKS